MPPLLIISSEAETADLSRHLRVARDDGMQPHGPDMVTGEFGESAGGDGAPLLAVNVTNREQAWPILIEARPHNQGGLINYVGNPRGAVSAAGWGSGSSDGYWLNATAGPPARTAYETAFGLNAGDSYLYVITDGTQGQQGLRDEMAGPFLQGVPYTCRLLLHGYAGRAREVFLGDAGPDHAKTTVSHDGWREVKITWVPAATRATGFVGVRRPAAEPDTISITNVMVAAADVAYFDGDLLEADWTGPRHGSVSVLTGAGKPGLHRMAAKLNRVLAAPTSVEWRDDGADRPSHLDPVFGRFEEAYDYLRARALWQGGTVRVTSRPFAHAGTARQVAVASDGRPFALFLGPLEGDAPAELDVRISIASQPDLATRLGTRRIVGYAVLPSGHRPYWPGASLNAFGFLPGATTVGVESPESAQRVTVGQGFVNIAAVSLPAGTPYRGRQRILALLKTTATGAATGIEYQAIDRDEGYRPDWTPLGMHDIGTLDSGPGMRVIDCGVSTIDPRLRPNPFVVVTARARGGASATVRVETAAVMILPEDGTMMIVDDAAAGQPSYALLATERRTVRHDQDPLMLRMSMDAHRRGAFAAATPGHAAQVAVFALPDGGAAHHTIRVGASVRVRDRFRYARP